MSVGHLLKFNIQPVPSCPGVYVSEEGNVYRRDRKAANVFTIRNPYLGKGGYYTINTKRNGKQGPTYVHSIICETFNGHASEGQVTRHLDGWQTNNHRRNLAWGSRRENSLDALAHGTLRVGERHGMAKLTEADVIEIRRAVAAGETHATTAKRFGIARQSVSDIVNLKYWKMVPGAPLSG